MEDDKRKSKVLLRLNSKTSTTRSIATIGGKSISRLRVRKQSYGFTSVAGIKTVEGMTQLPGDLKRPVLTYLNTYQLDPYVRFNPVHVEKVANTILDENFTDHKYNVQESPALAIKLAGLLMKEVKALNFNRYRVLSIVTIGQKRAQSYVNAVAFLWDHERDGYMNVQREVHTAFIQMTVFGIYLD